MARKGRKQLTVLIKEESFNKLEQIKEDLGLSNAKLVEMLIENYVNVNTNININTNQDSQILEKLENLQAQVQLLVDQKVQTQVITQEEPLIKNEKEPIKVKTISELGIKLAPNEKIVVGEDGIETLCIDSVPEWQKRELTPQDFYGKVPEPITYAALTWECEKCNHVWDGDEGDIVCPKCQSVYIDEKKED